MNFTEVTSFYLTGYYGMENTRALYFLLFLLIYLLIIAENALFIGMVYFDRSLHEPMYVLMCNLAVNGLYGGTALLPAVLSNILSHSKEISLALCHTQIYAIHTYAITEFTIIATMSYDRYMAICFPLTYHARMSRRLVGLVVVAWIYPMLAFLLIFIITLRLRFCKKYINKIYCVNYLLVQLSCTDTTVANILGLLSVALYVAPQLVMVVYSYAHILRICVKAFSKSKVKALRTCIPHLVAVLNYSIGCLFEIAQGRLENLPLSYNTRLFLAVYFLIFPPMLNPVIYGLSIQVFRHKFIQMFKRGSRKVQLNSP